MDKYGLPMGAIITPDAIAAAKANGKDFEVPEDKAGGPKKTKGKANFMTGTISGKAAAAAQKPGAAPKAEKKQALKVKKTELTGNKHFSVGESKYTAPNNSKLIKPKGNDALVYVVTPDGKVHAFVEAGEIEITAPLDTILETKFAGDLEGDAKYEVSEFDVTSASYDIEGLPVGAVLSDQEGNPQFKKTGPTDWEHVDLGVALDEKDIKPLYDSGELVPESTPDTDAAAGVFDDAKATNFTDMTATETQTALEGMPEGQVISIDGIKFTKGAGDEWTAVNSPNPKTSASLKYLKNMIKVGADEEPAYTPLDAMAKNPLDGDAQERVVGEQPDAAWVDAAIPGAKLAFKGTKGDTVWTLGDGDEWTNDKSTQALSKKVMGDYADSDDIGPLLTIKANGKAPKDLTASGVDKSTASPQLKKKIESDEAAGLHSEKPAKQIKDSASIGSLEPNKEVNSDGQEAGAGDGSGKGHPVVSGPESVAEELQPAGDNDGSGDLGGDGAGDELAPYAPVFLNDGKPLEASPRMEALKEQGIPVSELYELNAKKSAGDFHAAISKLKENNPYHASVYVYDETEYATMRLFTNDDGTAGVALKGDEIVSVFVLPTSKDKGSGQSLIAQAVAQGGKRLDAYDTVLPKIYAKEGFVPVARVPWTDSYAPDDWDKSVYAKYNNGEPAVVFMAYDEKAIGSDYDPTAGEEVALYDDATEIAKNFTPESDPAEDDFFASMLGALAAGTELPKSTKPEVFEKSPVPAEFAKDYKNPLPDMDYMDAAVAGDKILVTNGKGDATEYELKKKSPKAPLRWTNAGGGQYKSKTLKTWWTRSFAHNDNSQKLIPAGIPENATEIPSDELDTLGVGAVVHVSDSENGTVSELEKTSTGYKTTLDSGLEMEVSEVILDDANDTAYVDQDAAPKFTGWKKGVPVTSQADLDEQVPGTKLSYLKKDETTSVYTKLDNGAWLTPNGGVLASVQIKNAAKQGKFTIESVPETNEPLATAISKEGYVDGDVVTKYGHLRDMPAGQIVTENSVSGKYIVDYQKQEDGSWKSLPNEKFPNAHDVTPDELAEDILLGQLIYKAPEGELSDTLDTQLYAGGPAFSKKDISEALNALESHTGFQISYGLKSVPDNPLADKDAQDAIKAAALSKYPDLKPKPAVVRYLKDTLGIENEAAPVVAADAPKIWMGSKTPKEGVQGFDGGEFTAQDVQEAIDILEAFQGKNFKSALNLKGNALGTLNPNDLVGFEKDKTVGKQKFIALLKTKLEAHKEEEKHPKVKSYAEFKGLEPGTVVTYSDDKGFSETYEKLANGLWAPNHDDMSEMELDENNFEGAIAEGKISIEKKAYHAPAYAVAPAAVQDKQVDQIEVDAFTADNLPTAKPGTVIIGTGKDGDGLQWVKKDVGTGWSAVDPETGAFLISYSSDELKATWDKWGIQLKQSDGPDFNKSGLTPGMYVSGGKAVMYVNADGTGVYVNSKGAVSTLTVAAVKKNHAAGMNVYKGVPESIPTPAPVAKKATAAKKVPQGPVSLPDGTYYLGDPNAAKTVIYEVTGDTVKIFGVSGSVETFPLSKIKTAYFKGQILDANGNSMVPKNHVGSVTMWSAPTNVPALIKAKAMIEAEDATDFFAGGYAILNNRAGLYVDPSKLGKMIQELHPEFEKPAYWLPQYKNEPEYNEAAKALLIETIDNLLANADTTVPTGNAADHFEWTAGGDAVMDPKLVALNDLYMYDITSLTNYVNLAKATIGDGKVIGQVVMNKNQKTNWVKHFKAGDFKQLYAVEVMAAAEKGKSIPNGYMHPGFIDNPETNQVTWASGVPGEVSALDTVPGDWSGANVSWSLEEIDNYLIAASMQNPEYLTVEQKRVWVANHFESNKSKVDQMSSVALNAKNDGKPTHTPTPVWTDNVEPAKTYTFMFDSHPFPSGMKWQQQAYYVTTDWAKDNWDNPDFHAILKKHDPNNFINSKADVNTNNAYTTEKAVAEYFDGLHKEYEAELLIPKYHKVSEISEGSHPVYVIEDQFGRKSIFKPIPEGKDFRAEIEHAGNLIGQHWGFKSPVSEILVFEGETGQRQAFIDSVSDFKGMDYSSLNNKQIGQVAAEHVLDWMLDNDDTHEANLLLTPDGSVVGLDKGRAFKAYGQWYGVTGDGYADTNAPLAYTRMYDDIKTGKMSKEQAAAAYFAAIRVATKIQKSDSEPVIQMIKDGVKNRPDWDVPDYVTHFDHDGAPKNTEELINDFLKRKEALVEQIEEMWQKIFAQAGMETPEKPSNTLPEDQVFGLTDPKLMETAKEMKAWGAAPLTAHAGVEGGHTLIWNETDTQGAEQTFGQMKIGALTQKGILDFVSARVATPSVKTKQITMFPGVNAAWKSHISHYAKDITKNVIDKNFDADIETEYVATKAAIKGDLDFWTPELAVGKEDTDYIEFPSGKTVSVDGLLQYKLALNHYQKQIDAADAAKESGLTTAKDDFTPFMQPTIYKTNKTYTHADGDKYVELANGKFMYAHDGDVSIVDAVPDAVSALEDGWAGTEEDKGDNDNVLYTNHSAEGPNGKLLSDGSKISEGTSSSEGHTGQEYTISLPTGEVINFRNSASTYTAASQRGLLTFQLAPGADKDASLSRVTAHLSKMGLDVNDADATDAETVYWRQMFKPLLLSNNSGANEKVFAARTAIKAHASAVKEKTGVNPDDFEIIEGIGLIMTPDEEHEFWHNLANETFGEDKVEEWIADGKHFPKYQHMDLANPTANTGKPHWDRIDVDEKKILESQTLIAIGNSGKDKSLLNYITSGGMLSTEERLRVLGHFKEGTTSTDDQQSGGANSVFTRIAKPGATVEMKGNIYGDHVAYWNPKVLMHTSTYSFSSDNYGRLTVMPSENPADITKALNHSDNGNETMVSDAMSIFDYLEIFVFEDLMKRDQAIQRMKALGFETLRGIPIEERFVLRVDLKKAMAKVKTTW